jgi:D-lactate dehydrogenase
LRPLGREPHSVIGSSCIGASVIGGVCNNSGGALTRRGPAYTQMALFACVDAHDRLQMVNHLAVNLGDTPEEMLQRLQDGEFGPNDIEHPDRAGCDPDYARHVRDVNADTPARFNADPRRLYEASGSAGKIMIFAVRLDTFEMESDSTVFYVGANRPADLARLRRLILGGNAPLPLAAEYLHRDAFDLAERYGKDQFLLIEHLGTDRLPYFFDLKSRCDELCRRVKWLPPHMTDRLLQALSHLLPGHLPARLKDYRRRFEHHLLLRVSRDAVGEIRALLAAWSEPPSRDHFECSGLEARKAFLHRFAVAGAAVRYRAIHSKEVEDIVALDIALRRNDADWFETLPPEIDGALLKKVYYGHFLCHVLHQDYIVAKGHDCEALEHSLWRRLDARGARYPAEHNVGHLYHADPALRTFYRSLDPGNRFNAGIGRMSHAKDYAELSNAEPPYDIEPHGSEGLSA